MHPSDGEASRPLTRHALWLLIPALWLAACGPPPPQNEVPDAGNDPDTELPDGGDGDGEGNGDVEPEPPEPRLILTVEDQLDALGLDVASIQTSARPITDAASFDHDLSPLGRRLTLAPSEWVIAGLGNRCGQSGPSGPGVYHFGTQMHFECLWTETAGEKRPGYLDFMNRLSLKNPGTQSTRTLVTGRFSADVLEQAVIFNVHQPRSVGWQLTGWTLDNGVLIDHALPEGPDIVDTASTRGDFNGDGLDDILVGLLRGPEFSLYIFLQQPDHTFNLREPSSITRRSIEGTKSTDILSLSLAAGRLDGDAPDEVVVLARVWDPLASGASPRGKVHVYVFDHLHPIDGILPFLASPVLSYTDPERGAGQPIQTATVALGDFDADGLDELAIGGIGRLAPSYSEPTTYVTRILDDLVHGLEELATQVHQERHPHWNGSDVVGLILEVFTLAIEHDGDPARELLTNGRVLDLEGGQLREAYRYDPFISAHEHGHHSEATVAMGVGDAEGDGIHEVRVYHSSGGSADPMGVMEYWQHDDRRDRQQFSVHGAYPLIASLNSVHTYSPEQRGGTILEYVQGSHRTRLSAPVVHGLVAAAPAPPADRPDALLPSTSFEPAARSAIPVAAGASPLFGHVNEERFAPRRAEDFHLPGFPVALMRWGRGALGAREPEGELPTLQSTFEDEVLFSVMTYDAYDFVARTTTNELDEGAVLTVLLPRAPILKRVPLTVFNASIPQGSAAFEPFPHTPGAPLSYVTLNQASTLVRRATDADGWGAVGTTVRVEPGDFPYRSRLPLDARFHEVSAAARTWPLPLTGGWMISDFTSGPDDSVDLRLRPGEATAVVGVIPPLVAGSDTRSYDAGIFTYLERHASGQQFPVVNYWVE